MKKSLLLTVLLVFVFMVSFSLAKGIPLNSTTLPDIKISQNQALSYAFSLHNYHEIDDYSQCSIIQNFMDKVTLTSWGDVGIGSIGVVTSGTVIIRTDDGMAFSFLIKVVPYTLKRLPYVFLNKNQSTEFNLQGYCIDSEENPVIPLSFGTPGGLDARESDGITVQWTSDSTISITADSTFSTRARYWVYACDTTEADTQESIPFDREELFIFPNEIAQGGFDSQDDYNLWATDYLSGTMALTDSYWVASDTDAAGESANGVLRVDFTTNNSAIKITPSLSQMPTVEQGDWMIARMRVCCDEADNNFEGSLFNFRNVVESGAHVNVAGHVWFGMPTTWTWIETPVYCSDSGVVYPQLVFSLNIVMPTFSSPDSVLIGSIKVDEVQLIRATPQLLLGRNFIREMFAAGQFKYTDDLTDGWSVEPLPSLTGDNELHPPLERYVFWILTIPLVMFYLIQADNFSSRWVIPTYLSVPLILFTRVDFQKFYQTRRKYYLYGILLLVMVGILYYRMSQVYQPEGWVSWRPGKKKRGEVTRLNTPYPALVKRLQDEKLINDPSGAARIVTDRHQMASNLLLHIKTIPIYPESEYIQSHGTDTVLLLWTTRAEVVDIPLSTLDYSTVFRSGWIDLPYRHTHNSKPIRFGYRLVQTR